MKATLRHTIYTVLAFLCSIQTYAYDFEVDGIYYNLVSASELTCEVVSYSEDINGYYNLNKYEGNIVIPENVTVNGKTLTVTRIGNYAFSGCENLYSISMPNSIQEIGNFAFYGCENLYDVTLSEDLRIIGMSAFRYCRKLRKVKFPNTLEEIYYDAFAYTALQSVDFPENVREIKDRAFSECEGLTQVIIPPSVKRLGANAFSACPNIVNFIIQDSPTSLDVDNRVEYIPTYAKNVYFGRNCSLSVDSSESIEYGQYYTDPISVRTGMFETSSKLKKIIISGSVNEICGDFGNSLTQGKLECLIIKDSNTSLKISPKAFINFHVDTMYIGRNIVDNNNNNDIKYPDVSNLTLTGSIEDEPSSIYWSCKNLKVIRLGENIKSCSGIGSKILESIIVEATIPPVIYGFAFDPSNYVKTHVQVPKGTLGLYQSADVWKDFWNITEFEDSPQVPEYSVQVQGNSYGTYTIDGVSNSMIEEGKTATITFIPSEGYYVESVRLNGTDVTSDLKDNTLIIDNINSNQSVNVTFSRTPIYVTINNAEGGSVQQLADYGKSYTFYFIANEGWNINTVTFNSEDVTESVNTDGYYTTPIITADASISVVFVKSESDAIYSAKASQCKLYATSESITIKDAEIGNTVSIYGTDGKNLLNTSIMSSCQEIPFSDSGLYIIKVGTQTFKLIK